MGKTAGKANFKRRAIGHCRVPLVFGLLLSLWIELPTVFYAPSSSHEVDGNASGIVRLATNSWADTGAASPGGQVTPHRPSFFFRLRLRPVSPTPTTPEDSPATTDAVIEEPEPTHRKSPRTVRKDLETGPRSPDHPEITGSLAARGFFLQNAMGFDRGLAATVWKSPKTTLKMYETALREARKKADRRAEREVVTNLGHVNYLLGLFKKSENAYSQALEIAKTTDDHVGAARLLNNLGGVYSTSGRYNQARERYEAALSSLAKLADATGQGMVLNNLAVLAKNRGRFKEAVNFLEKSLIVDKNLDDLRILKLTNLGIVYMIWGCYREAGESFSGATPILREQRDIVGLARNLIFQAEAFRARGRNDEAARRLREALELPGLVDSIRLLLNNLVGSVYTDQDNAQEAEPYVKEGAFNSGLGRLSLMKADWEATKTYYERLRESAIRYNRTEDLFVACTGLGKTFEASKNLGRAEQFYEKALEASEEIRSGLLLSERGHFFATPVHGFLPSEAAKGLIRTRMKRKQVKSSIYPGEMTRAREFADRLGLRSSEHIPDVPKEVLEREEALFNNLASLTKARSLIPESEFPERYRTITQEIQAARKDITKFVTELRNTCQRYASVRHPRPVELKDAAIRPDEYLLLFDVLGDGVAIKLIKGKNVLYSSYEQWSLQDLRKDIEQFRKSFEEHDLTAYDEERARSLYKRLLFGALGKVPNGTPVMIVPDDLLAVLPFEALVAEGAATWKDSRWGPYPEGLTYVGDQHPVSYCQSITALTLGRNLPRKTTDANRLLVIGDPIFHSSDDRISTLIASEPGEKDKSVHTEKMVVGDSNLLENLKLKRLSETGDLAVKLKGLHRDSESYTGMQATKKMLFSEVAPRLHQYRWIVLATHAFAGQDLPGVMEPCIMLTSFPAGTDGVVKMTEVLGLKLDADVVALTACETGYGQYLPGEGIMSLGRAFQCAGARLSVVSLWPVAEAPSVKLIESFFRNLIEGKKEIEAWQTARKEVRDQGGRHPFYWAPFILVGDVD